MQSLEQRESHDRAIRKPGVLFSPFVSNKTTVRLLQRSHEMRNLVLVHQISAVEKHEQLHCGQRVEQVRIVSHIATVTRSVSSLTRHHKVQHGLTFVALGKSTQKIQRSETPINSVQLQMLSGPIFKSV